MQSKKQYHTKQRDNLIEFFKKNKGECFTAKQLIENKDVNIGEATIYRLLMKLTDDGELKRFIPGKDAGAAYQYNAMQCNNHFHLKCLVCARMLCVEYMYMGKMEEHMKCEYDFLIDNTKTIIYGTCRDCKI